MTHRHNKSQRRREPKEGKPLRGYRVMVALVIAIGLASFAEGQECGNNEPGTPVPEFRNGVRLWPVGFSPGLPGQTLPPDRDSTQWRSTTIAGTRGDEQFQSLDVVGQHLYVAFNSGIQVRDISGNNAESPKILLGANGWNRDGQWGTFPPTGEQDYFVHDISAIADSDGSVLLAVAGKDGVGMSMWRHMPAVGSSRGSLTQFFQDPAIDTRQVKTINQSGTVYAVAAGPSGVHAYDMAAGITLGRVGSLSVGGDDGYVDVLERGGIVYVAASDGNPRVQAPMGLEIWSVPNLSNPANASLKVSDLTAQPDDVSGTTMFRHGGGFYLAAVQKLTTGRVLKIFRIDSCLDSDGCSSLGSPVWSRATSPTPITAGFLTFSVSNGTPFLYYGFQSINVQGSAIEMLLDLTTLGTTNQITEITAGGASYIDPCNGERVDYWGAYHDDNDKGLRNVSGRVGKFAGDFFYRAAAGILDVHERGETPVGPPPPPPPPGPVDPPPPPPPPPSAGLQLSFRPADCSGVCTFCAGKETRWITSVSGGVADGHDYDWDGNGTFDESSPQPVPTHVYGTELIGRTFIPHARAKIGLSGTPLTPSTASVAIMDCGEPEPPPPPPVEPPPVEPPAGCGAVNGDGGFCNAGKCGPCGIWQGDCDKDAECKTGLFCKDDVGNWYGPRWEEILKEEFKRTGLEDFEFAEWYAARFGDWGPKTDVCTDPLRDPMESQPPRPCKPVPCEDICPTCPDPDCPVIEPCPDCPPEIVCPDPEPPVCPPVESSCPDLPFWSTTNNEDTGAALTLRCMAVGSSPPALN